MPQRQGAVRVDSTAVQGEGAYVVLRKLTVGEIKTMRNEAGKEDADTFTLSDDIIRARIVEWNWCDESGAPLPQPREHPEVCDSLTDDEFAFLAEAIAGSAEARKN